MDISISPLTSTTHPCSSWAQQLTVHSSPPVGLRDGPCASPYTQQCCTPSPCPCHHRGSAQQLLSLSPSPVFSFAWSFQHQQGTVSHLLQISCSPLFLEECCSSPGTRLPCALLLSTLLPCWHPVPSSSSPQGSSPTLSSPGVELQPNFVLELVWAPPAPLLAPLSAPAQWNRQHWLALTCP